MSSQLLAQAQPKLQKAYDHLAEELKTIRSGRATPLLVEDVKVDVYGAPMALKQMANISATDAKSLTITPWDPNNLLSIEKAIRETPKLDLEPSNDGKSLHLNIPPLTGQRREELIKQVNEKVENTYVSLRNIRHEVLNTAKNQQKDKQISEDDYHWLDKQLGAKIDGLRDQIEQLAERKRAEIREI